MSVEERKGSPFRSLLRSRWFALGAGVVALALIIVVAAALSTPKLRPPRLPATPSTVEAADETLAKQAAVAASTGDTTTAITLANKALQANPKNKTAKQIIDDLNKVDTDDPAKEETKTPSDTGFDKPVKDLKVLLPSKIANMDRLMYQASSTDAQVPFNPVVDSPTFHGVLFSVHDAGTREKAKQFIDKVVKVAFDANSGSVTVSGVSGYFGMRGQIGEVGFTRGRFAFECAVTGGNASPDQLRTMAVALASKIPTRAP